MLRGGSLKKISLTKHVNIFTTSATILSAGTITLLLGNKQAI